MVESKHRAHCRVETLLAKILILRYVPLQLFLLASLSFATPAEAKRVKLEVGATAPKVDKLQDLDGKPYASSGLEKAKAIAIIFTSHECPVAQSYIDRLAKLQADFQKKGFGLITINANKGVDLKAMRAHAKKHKIQYAYLRDETQGTAKSFGALLTPEAFLLNGKRKIVYKGAIDNDVKLNGKPTQNYLRDAIESVLAGKTPKKTSSRAMGCRILWK